MREADKFSPEEHLEEAQEMLRYMQEESRDFDTTELETMRWLIEQADHVSKENIELSRALEFYADGSNWTTTSFGVHGYGYRLRHLVNGDAGDIARKAMEEKS